MTILKCKLCDCNSIVVIGEISQIEPAVSCSNCGYTNKQNANKQEKRTVIIEYRK